MVIICLVTVILVLCASDPFIFNFNSLPNNKFLDWSKLKAFADEKFNITQTLKFVLGRVENFVRKCWLPPFSPFPTMFSKGYYLRVVKTMDCLGKG